MRTKKREGNRAACGIVRYDDLPSQWLELVWQGKQKTESRGRVFDPQRVNLVGTKGTLRFVRNNTSWSGRSMLRGRPFNDFWMTRRSLEQRIKMSYPTEMSGQVFRSDDVLSMETARWYMQSIEVEVCFDRKGRELANEENIHVLDPSSVTFNTSARVIGEAKPRYGDGMCSNGRVYVLNGFEVRFYFTYFEFYLTQTQYDRYASRRHHPRNLHRGSLAAREEALLVVPKATTQHEETIRS